MKKFIYLFSAIAILFSVSALGNPVKKNKAESVAKNYMAKYDGNRAMNTSYFSTYHLVGTADLPLYHIFTKTDGGFVIISGDDVLSPVLGFSDEGTINMTNPSPEFMYWMSSYVDYINYTRQNKTQTSARVAQEWNKLRNPQVATKGETKDVGAMVSTKWNQGAGYNLYCPADAAGAGGHCYAGCVATAMSQVMKFYNYPEIGTGSYSYVHPHYLTQSAIFDTTHYEWSKMSISSNNNSKYAISLLMYHCGVAVNMNYGTDGSGSQTEYIVNALKTYFGYRMTINYQDRANYSTEIWKIMLRNNINKGYPLVYSGSDAVYGGHAWVCDGYKDSNYFHMNWGWGGAEDGYFLIDTLSDGDHNFDANHGAVFDIVPKTANYCNTFNTNEDYNVIEDGSANSFYKNNTSCSWKITPYGTGPIVLQFTSMNTEANVDVVKVYDGNSESAPLIGTYSGNTLPPTILSTSNKLYITFSTDGQNQYQGWSANYALLSLGLENEQTSFDGNVWFSYSNKSININCKNCDGKKSVINVYNVLGKQILSKNITIENNNTTSIGLGNIPAGVYIIDVNTDGQQKFTRKFVVE